MDQTMEMGKSAGMAQNPDMAKEKTLMMEKERMKAMIDGMDESQLAMMGEMMDKVNEPPENPEGEADDTTLSWDEPRESADAKLKLMGM